ncbi:MAG TPA: maleylpyruvate isomerase family mycothiol-dependent enzyme, partial [Mycobacteriales bacterium]|nr:maleylpyruvate isomerase family mycothiol-dependent enzyme [Mycobacteriales bacterium]
LEREGAELALAAASASLADPVPGCPDWAVRDLVGHVGYVHRWAAAVVSGRLEGPEGDAAAAVGPIPGDDGLLDWYTEGHQALVDTLRTAPADVACFTFLPAPSPLAFWARRQALETAIHHADACAAANRPVSFAEDLAHDGIDETLLGFGARRREFEPGSIRLQPGDGPAWRIDLGPEGAKATHDATAGASDATVAGTPTQVYLWLWNRPTAIDVTGDAEVAERWKRVRVRLS